MYVLVCLRPYTVNFKWAHSIISPRLISCMWGILPKCRLKHTWQVLVCASTNRQWQAAQGTSRDSGWGRFRYDKPAVCGPKMMNCPTGNTFSMCWICTTLYNYMGELFVGPLCFCSTSYIILPCITQRWWHMVSIMYKKLFVWDTTWILYLSIINCWLSRSWHQLRRKSAICGRNITSVINKTKKFM